MIEIPLKLQPCDTPMIALCFNVGKHTCKLITCSTFMNVLRKLEKKREFLVLYRPDEAERA